MTKWTRLTPGTKDDTGLAIVYWMDSKWLVIRAGSQEYGELCVDRRGGSMALSTAELANIPQPPERVEVTP